MARNRPRRSSSLFARLSAGVRSRLGWLALREGVGEGSEAAPRYFLLFLLLFAAGMVLISLLGDQGLISYHRLRAEQERLTGEVARLEERKLDLARRIRALREDPGYVELLARQRLGLVRPGDVVIQLPERRP
jgi:cell division protein FtsB